MVFAVCQNYKEDDASVEVSRRERNGVETPESFEVLKMVLVTTTLID